MIQVLAIVGPTASGKTSSSLDLAESLGTEIVSADSMQFYRGMEIGTGQPSADEQARVPHHLVASMSPAESTSAGEYQTVARAIVRELNERGTPAVVVGGSGLYLRALIDGLFDGPAADNELRERLLAEAEERGGVWLHARLADLDPEAAARIHPGDIHKMIRALEVVELSGAPITELHEQGAGAARTMNTLQFAIDWPREELYERINRRVDRMIEAGLLDEVRALVEAGHRDDLIRLRPIGYPEMLAVLDGSTALEDAIETMKMNTRRYAKRQLTWFRSDERIEWLSVNDFRTNAARVAHILARLEAQRSPA